MRKAAIRSVILGIVSILVISSSATARPGPGSVPPPGSGPEPAPMLLPPPPPADPVLGPAGHILMRLNLTPEQRRRVETIVEDALEGGGLEPLLRSFGEARHAVELKVSDPATDAAALDEAVRVLEERGHRLLEARRGLAAQVMSVLTPDQRVAFQKMLAAPRGGPE